MTPSGNTVRITASGPVTIITIDRPAVRNAVDPATAKALYSAFAAFEADPSAFVAILTGAGSVFCAGYDLAAASALADPDIFRHEIQDALAFPKHGDPPHGPMGPTRLPLSKPVIAAIEGPAVAGGLELALWCDMRVMAQDAYFGVYCRRWGIPLIDGGTVRLPRLIGMGRAMDLILTGRKVEAEEALRIGLCDRIVPVGQALPAAQALARELTVLPQAALRADRQSAYESFGISVRAGLENEWTRGIAAFAAEGAAGAGRFLDRHEPRDR